MNRYILPVVVTILALAVVSCERTPESGTDRNAHDTVRRGNGGDPGTLDPLLAEDIHAFNVLLDVHEGLTTESSTGEIVPGVATSWEVSADGLVYTFKIRDEARWSNGDPVVASDFVRSFRRAASPDTASAYVFLLQPIANFAAVRDGSRPGSELGVSAVSERQLEIRLSAPTNHWLAILSLPIAFATHESGELQISNGAFTIEERQVDGPIRLTKNPLYWAADTVEVEEVIYFPTSDPAAELNSYRAGELDITSTIPSEFVNKAVEELPGETRIAPTLALYYFAFDLTEPPFDDAALRQALSMAVDRGQLTSLLGRGEQAAYGIVPPGVAGHRNAHYAWRTLANERREQQARELYAEAGYTIENPLRIQLLYDAGDKVHERIALAVSAMWRDTLGVETTIEKREWRYFLESREQRDEWDVMRFAWAGDYNGANTFLDIFRSDNEQNLAHYQNADYDAQLDAAARQVELQTAAALLHDAEATLIGDYPVIPLYFFVSKHLVKPNIIGFDDSVVDRHPSRYLKIVDKK